MKRDFSITVITILLISFGIMTSSCNNGSLQTISTLDYGEENGEYLLEKWSFEQMMQDTDLLLVGTCLAVEPGVPEKG